MKGPYKKKGTALMNDHDILTLLKERDEIAIEALKERFDGMCFALASNILADRRDVEECVSTVYFKLWSHIPPAEPKNLTAYVAKTVRNEALMRYRANASKRSINVSSSLEELENCLGVRDNMEDVLEAESLAKAVEDYISLLPAEQRVSFMRRYWFFDSAKAIAESLGITVNRVNTLLVKTRRQIRRYLIKEEYINE